LSREKKAKKKLANAGPGQSKGQVRDSGARRSHRTLRVLVWPLAFSVLIVAALALAPRLMRRAADGTSSTVHPVAAAKFVGTAECVTCHQRESASWRGSHHQLAMQPATDAAVLGDFNNARFSNAGVTSAFFRRGKKFIVRTDGPDGALHDYEIGFTFGVAPLQQYLIAMPGGRLQSLGIAWDSRPRKRGGQRWYYLYPGQKISAYDPLHWTGIDQNWNYMCADCHSTNVRKNYDPQTRTYATTYAEVNVACEACHGPGSNHVAWAKKQGDWNKVEENKGLTIALDERKNARWIVDHATGSPHRSSPRVTQREIQMCARCHSRRGLIHEDYVHGQPVGDDYRVALLEPDLYFPDGQIKGEVYEYGSFIQSRMFHAGVTCSDCHDPHSLKLRADGDNVCLQCHLAQKYDSPKHHFHKARSAGARCVECHMPTRLYMVVDARRDHSIRIPRPDLSMKLGTPNACNQCHVDKAARWASDAIVKWYGHERRGFQQFADALYAGSEGAPGAPQALSTLVVNRSQPAIARGSALSLLASYDPAATSEPLRAGIADDSALVRRAATSAMFNSNPRESCVALGSLLTDPVRAVRIEAARVLASTGANTLPSEVAALDRARNEYVAAQELNADRPEAHLDLALLFVRERKFERAETELKTALSLDPSFTPAAVNLADLYREAGRDGEGEAVLHQVLERSPYDAAALHALGLWLVRHRQNQEALSMLAGAARLDPANARYVYVYAIALNDSGQTRAAIETLEDNIKLHPYDRDSLAALVAFCDQTGKPFEALTYARRFNEVDPGDPQMLQTITRLNGQVGQRGRTGSEVVQRKEKPTKHSSPN
jgi:tetratricopeptide (TPR) repeat protein